DPVFGHQSGDINNPIDAASLELTPANNQTGRQANRGMEGLAITPDGGTLAGIMQNALIQDNGLVVLGDPHLVPGRRGLNNRILTIDLDTRATHEYVYTVDAINQGRGVNEMLAINDHEFLVLERDNRTRLASPPTTPNLKRIYKIDLRKNGPNDVTDVSDVVSLPETGAQLAAANIVPVKKTLFIDLLKDVYKVDATHTIKDVIAEKIEGLAWGPDLPDGRHVLYVISDNDLNTGIATQIYAFAVNETQAGISYAPQQLPDPLFPPGQVKKALR
ncbi:MAG TPA: esterase-like activity of phytase family protein, partial [Vicinamibacterales bacterium]|nr:esterase-like activity of phytase family protein [Vicinamibacterales bacterium]